MSGPIDDLPDVIWDSEDTPQPNWREEDEDDDIDDNDDPSPVSDQILGDILGFDVNEIDWDSAEEEGSGESA
jgi:hypothetical protein